MTPGTRWRRPNEKPLENADRGGSWRPLIIKSARESELSASFDRQASATKSVSWLGLFQTDVRKTVSFFVSFRRGKMPSWILFLVSIQ
jgi:hypothetical protein